MTTALSSDLPKKKALKHFVKCPNHVLKLAKFTWRSKSCTKKSWLVLFSLYLSRWKLFQNPKEQRVANKNTVYIQKKFEFWSCDEPSYVPFTRPRLVASVLREARNVVFMLSPATNAPINGPDATILTLYIYI